MAFGNLTSWFNKMYELNNSGNPLAQRVVQQDPNQPLVLKPELVGQPLPGVNFTGRDARGYRRMKSPMLQPNFQTINPLEPWR